MTKTKVIFCLPGRTFSDNFLKSWTNLITELPSHNIKWGTSQKYHVNRYFVCNSCLGGSSIGGKNQKPFQGKVDYDYIMWIDIDQVFKPEDFFNLLNKRQLSPAKKIKFCDYVINNNGSLKLLKKNIKNIMIKI